jgi:hypothetical protein
MTVSTAKAEMLQKMTEYAERFSDLGFITSVRSYFTDKALEESEMQKRGSETLWCELSVRAEGGEDDAIVFDLFRDLTKSGDEVITDAANSDSETFAAIEELYTTLSDADEPVARFNEEYSRISEQFGAEMKEFEKKLKRLKILSLAAVAIVLISIGAVLIASLF